MPSCSFFYLLLLLFSIDIFAKAQKALLLSSAQQVLAYHGIKKRLAEFRLLNARGVVDPADVPMIIKHVNEFIQLCKDNVSIDIDDQIVTVHDRGLRDSHKRIFKNLGTQNVIVHLMKSLNNIKAEEDDDGNDTNFDWESKDDPIINAMAACMILLEQLCVDDKDLQVSASRINLIGIASRMQSDYFRRS